ncbi:hypothetical protein OEA41_007743 [Lepraria neglecta]|uniref:Uncharacterized protein n=1 Tax=Lepraria neglecta TaxID=209136 RepID=A0AAD9ZE41_9LECA|nr:hypothetical protein OEA41_007743 [Lepraria neglecta]
MEWPGGITPVVFNTRPGQHRGRLNSEYNMNRQPMYFQDANGMLVPAAAVAPFHRSASARRPAQIVIHNEFDPPSPVRARSHRRHSSHGRDYRYDDDYSSDEPEHSPRRHRSRRGHRTPSRSPSPYYDADYERKMKKLEELEEKEKEEAAHEKYEEERILKEARKAKKKKEEDELKKKAIEEHEIKKLEEKAKKDKEKKEQDEEFKKRVKETFGHAGYDEESIEKVLKKGEKEGHKNKEKQIIGLRPMCLKVHQKHISPDTLNAYDLPWEWDTRDLNYILIQQWIPESGQAILFEHTRTLRERKQLTDTTIELKKERDKLLLVRQKSPGRKRSPSRNWMFT